MRILFLGDVYGEAGLKALEKFLPEVKSRYPYDVFFINGENVSEGLGLRKRDYKRLMEFGAHAVTLGNHSFSKKELLDYIEESNIVRPLNYPKTTPGKGFIEINYNNQKIVLIQIMGRIFMGDPLNNPFETLDDVLAGLEADCIVVDLHAEATSEKLAIAHYLDGRVDAVIGTHTHVATNDAMRLPKGTYYITDAGMCGAKYGILGADRDKVLKRFTTGIPHRLTPEVTNTVQLNGVFIDTEKGAIETINISD